MVRCDQSRHFWELESLRPSATGARADALLILEYKGPTSVAANTSPKPSQPAGRKRAGYRLQPILPEVHRFREGRY